MVFKRCKNCGASDARTSIDQHTGFCLDCQSDWKSVQDEIQHEKDMKRALKEKDFYKF